MLFGELWLDNVFTLTGHSGEVPHVNVLVTRFKQLIRRVDLSDPRFHDLRHTSATLQLGQGAYPKVVQESLGLADIAMTLNRYSHVTPDMQRQTANTLDAVLGSGQSSCVLLGGEGVSR